MGGIYQAATLRSSVEGANTHTDVYSFRVLLLELCTRHPPYDPSIPPPTRARVVVRGRPYRPPPGATTPRVRHPRVLDGRSGCATRVCGGGAGAAGARVMPQDACLVHDAQVMECGWCGN